MCHIRTIYKGVLISENFIYGTTCFLHPPAPKPGALSFLLVWAQTRAETFPISVDFIRIAHANHKTSINRDPLASQIHLFSKSDHKSHAQNRFSGGCHLGPKLMYCPISCKYGELNGLTLLQKNDPLRVPDCTLSSLPFGTSNSIDAVLMREPAGEPVDSDRSTSSIVPHPLEWLQPTV